MLMLMMPGLTGNEMVTSAASSTATVSLAAISRLSAAKTDMGNREKINAHAKSALNILLRMI